VLALPSIRSLRTDYSYPYTSREDYGPMAADLVADEARNALIVDAVLADARAGHVCLVLSGRVEHCKALAADITAGGIEAEALTAKVGKRKRAELLARARSGDLRVLVATSLADEGLDLPLLSRVVLAFPTRSAARTVQRLGRLMRPHPDKGQPVLTDVVDHAVPVLRNQSFARRRVYREVLGA